VKEAADTTDGNLCGDAKCLVYLEKGSIEKIFFVSISFCTS